MIANFTREGLALVADASLSGARVARELDVIIQQLGRSEIIVSDNGTELTSNVSHRQPILTLSHRSDGPLSDMR